jgi:hypothetical protein
MPQPVKKIDGASKQPDRADGSAELLHSTKEHQIKISSCEKGAKKCL